MLHNSVHSQASAFSLVLSLGVYLYLEPIMSTTVEKKEASANLQADMIARYDNLIL